MTQVRESGDEESDAGDGEIGKKESVVPILLCCFADCEVPGTAFKDSDGTEGWELGKRKRLTVTTFKGNQYVNIREYYEKDGKV